MSNPTRRPRRHNSFLAQLTASERWLKVVAVLLAVLAALWGGFIAIETRYARAADTRQQIDGLKALYFQQRISDLEREEFSFQREAQRRRLMELEVQRLETIRKELEHLKKQLQPILPKR